MEKENTILYSKEKEYKFFKLMAADNVSGIIMKNFKEYKVKVRISNRLDILQEIKSENTQIVKKFKGKIKIPLTAVNINNNEETITVSNGDLLEMDGKKYEIIDYYEINEETEHYGIFYLTGYFKNIGFDKYRTELNNLFYTLFNRLNIEAVIYSAFFQNEYFKNCNRSFLTYDIVQVGKMNDFTSFADVLENKDNYESEVRIKRNYRVTINYYLKPNDIDLDLVLSKNIIFEHILKRTSFRFEHIKDFEIQNLDLLSENEVIVNDKILNKKVYNLEFKADTIYNFKNDYIERINLTGKLKNKED
ncbi:hypothetical protein EII29_08280 [Leptotrichia sp. OH3620_COT-345]|uniref:hypothetical protein n=1 Tax=Leptotrichia sp. OH3620_COT-345 TaxID=2491048 RepID=UPI000F64A44C|nr:hypothetical protein [Leptotrichia sp. OH3620_COT-345]RRD39103.1 hypothetical protein EII29_08280 [Leptotrichia sp. OH3620_COT-345]